MRKQQTANTPTHAHPPTHCLHRWTWRSPFLLRQFGRWDDGYTLTVNLRNYVLFMAAQTWSRLECLFNDWPASLLRNTVASRAALHTTHTCCLDSWFSEPLRAAFTLEDLEGPEQQQLLRTLSRHMCTTNMGLEALIAETRQSVTYSKAKPSLESLHYLGTLTQLYKNFVGAGCSAGSM